MPVKWLSRPPKSLLLAVYQQDTSVRLPLDYNALYKSGHRVVSSPSYRSRRRGFGPKQESVAHSRQIPDIV